MSPADLATLLEQDAATIDQQHPRVPASEWETKGPNYHFRRGRASAMIDVAQVLRKSLVPRWSREVPTRTGLYWRRADNGAQPFSVVSAEGVLFAYPGTIGVGCKQVELWGGEWSGPIPAPLDP